MRFHCGAENIKLKNNIKYKIPKTYTFNEHFNDEHFKDQF